MRILDIARFVLERLTLERLLALLYWPVYKLRFLRLGHGTFISPFVESAGLEYFQIGNSSCVRRYTRLLAYGKYGSQHLCPSVIIGNNVSIGVGCTISCANMVRIDDDVVFGDKVYVADAGHQYESGAGGVIQQPLTLGAVVIEKGAWLGYGAFVAGDVVIGERAVVGANSVVTKSVPPFTVVAGAPARPIKRYNPVTDCWEKVAGY